MMISCLLPFYNQFPHNAHFVDEAVESFLRQDYPNRELLICNDTPGQIVTLHAPNIHVFNLSERCETLSDKLQFLIAQAKGEAFCRWDSDDISLPWRLELSAERLAASKRSEWRAENHWYSERNKIISETVSPGNTHTMALWTRQALHRIGGYPPKRCGDEDQQFNLACARAGVSFKGEILPKEKIFYIYRWGMGANNLSGHKNLVQGYADIGKATILEDEYEIVPGWLTNYVEQARRACDK